MVNNIALCSSLYHKLSNVSQFFKYLIIVSIIVNDISDKILNLLFNFLRNRKQKVVLKGQISLPDVNA